VVAVVRRGPSQPLDECEGVVVVALRDHVVSGQLADEEVRVPPRAEARLDGVGVSSCASATFAARSATKDDQRFMDGSASSPRF